MYFSPSVMVWTVPLGPNQKLAGMHAGLNPLASENELTCLVWGESSRELASSGITSVFNSFPCFPELKIG